MNLSDKCGKSCYYCRRPMDKPTKDHLLPKSHSGYNTPENIVLCCFSCNQWKGNKLLPDWLYEVTTWIKRGSKHPVYTKTQLGQISGNIKKKIAEMRGKVVGDYRV